MVWVSEYMAQDTSSQELEHFGVKGMKWGVRHKYQNYDGNYTQRGVGEFHKAASAYDSAHAAKKQAKKDYKSGKTQKLDYNRAKTNQKVAKGQVKKAYNHLRVDKRADKGRNLYQSGRTIRGSLYDSARSEAMIGVGSYVLNEALKTSNNPKLRANHKTITAAAVAGASAVNAIAYGVNYNRNAKLRAYYAHSGYRYKAPKSR